MFALWIVLLLSSYAIVVRSFSAEVSILALTVGPHAQPQSIDVILSLCDLEDEATLSHLHDLLSTPVYNFFKRYVQLEEDPVRIALLAKLLQDKGRYAKYGSSMVNAWKVLVNPTLLPFVHHDLLPPTNCICPRPPYKLLKANYREPFDFAAFQKFIGKFKAMPVGLFAEDYHWDILILQSLPNNLLKHQFLGIMGADASSSLIASFEFAALDGIPESAFLLADGGVNWGFVSRVALYAPAVANTFVNKIKSSCKLQPYEKEFLDLAIRSSSLHADKRINCLIKIIHADTRMTESMKTYILAEHLKELSVSPRMVASLLPDMNISLLSSEVKAALVRTVDGLMRNVSVLWTGPRVRPIFNMGEDEESEVDVPSSPTFFRRRAHSNNMRSVFASLFARRSNALIFLADDSNSQSSREGDDSPVSGENAEDRGDDNRENRQHQEQDEEFIAFGESPTNELNSPPESPSDHGNEGAQLPASSPNDINNPSFRNREECPSLSEIFANIEESSPNSKLDSPLPDLDNPQVKDILQAQMRRIQECQIIKDEAERAQSLLMTFRSRSIHLFEAGNGGVRTDEAAHPIDWTFFRNEIDRMDGLRAVEHIRHKTIIKGYPLKAIHAFESMTKHIRDGLYIDLTSSQLTKGIWSVVTTAYVFDLKLDCSILLDGLQQLMEASSLARLKSERKNIIHNLDGVLLKSFYMTLQEILHIIHDVNAAPIV